MKISVIAYSDECDSSLLSRWIDHYQQSKTTLPCTLIYHEVPQKILDMWPYEKIAFDPKIEINEYDQWSTVFKKMVTCDIMKLLSYQIIGETLTVDYDAFIKTQITSEMIPNIKWGICKHSKYSNYFRQANAIMYDLVHYDEFDIVPWCNCGIQILKQDYSKDFFKFFKKYIKRTYQTNYIETYAQDIISLTHKYHNGVYLIPEWNWYAQSSVPNNRIIFEHHYGKYAKTKLE